MGSKETSRYDEEEKVTIVKNDKGQVVGRLYGDLDKAAEIMARFFLKRIPTTPPPKR
ncbi:hypothetical protein [Alicyclobacillus fastidiosus]|uniref:hypothetical protein n=1 Tax=Alicyclobacillus fastidiosus TaxID=392011 RepID=UPI0023E9A41F|nr:hypothetical protein [Alicyclobacillus fastidiosus]GMA66026.1 hypothetical protein GCM10025859_64680 [Alicyclobacillus fastidiosus]